MYVISSIKLFFLSLNIPGKHHARKDFIIALGKDMTSLYVMAMPDCADTVGCGMFVCTSTQGKYVISIPMLIS